MARGSALFPAIHAGIAAIALCSRADSAPPRFAAEFIPGGLNPSAINGAGDIVGTNHAPMRGWISRSGGAAALLPLPAGASSSSAIDINELGVVVGVVSSASSTEFNGRAAAWVPGSDGGYTVIELGALPGNAISHAQAANNAGDIVGFSSNGTYRTATLFRIGMPPLNLGAAGLFDPQDVNDRRVVVDRSFICRSLDLNTMVMQELGTPGAGYIASTAVAINEHSQVAGLVIRATSTSCDREAATHAGDAGWQVLSTCGPYNGAQDINDRGDVVMTVQLKPYLHIEGDGTWPIDALIDSPTGQWSSFTLSGASISNSRQIAMSASNAALGLAGCVRLTPIGTPADLNGDGRIDAIDLSALLASWGACLGCAADLDGDGIVGSPDLAALLAAWSSP